MCSLPESSLCCGNGVQLGALPHVQPRGRRCDCAQLYLELRAVSRTTVEHGLHTSSGSSFVLVLLMAAQQ